MLLIKTGGLATISGDFTRRNGDFEGIFASALGLPADQLESRFVQQGDTLDRSPADYRAVLVSGSESMVSTPEPWMAQTAGWLRECLAAGTPLLGVCFGHQLLAFAAGATIAPNPAGPEIGTVTVHFADDRAGDPLFAPMGDTEELQAWHEETVLTRPPGASVLARSAGDAHHVLRYAKRSWGVQFHPELTRTQMDDLLKEMDGPLRARGLAPQSLRETLRHSPAGTALMRRFARLALE
ncbi:MAG: glutamine amidotransferase [Pararhodobacter sp.]|nr:glutamine amidotransferase [Pararhodobacter sp.]